MTVNCWYKQVYQKHRTSIETKTTVRQSGLGVIEISSLKAGDVSEVRQNCCDSSTFI